MKTFTVTLIKDDDSDDLILPFPQELLDEVKWDIGDTVEWIDNKDGTWSLRKKEND